MARGASSAQSRKGHHVAQGLTSLSETTVEIDLILLGLAAYIIDKMFVYQHSTSEHSSWLVQHFYPFDFFFSSLQN